MVSYDGQRTSGRDAPVMPLRSPTLGEYLLYVVNHPKATPRCGSQLHGGPRILLSMRPPEPAPRDDPRGTASFEDPVRRHWNLGLSTSESAYPQAKSASWEVSDLAPAYPLSTRHVACKGRGDFTVALGVSSAATCHRTGGGCTGRHSPTNPPVPLWASTHDQGLGRDNPAK